MKLRFKLITTIVSICIMSALLFVGVYAATTPEVNLQGTVSFDANETYATVDVQNATASATSKANLSFESIYTNTFNEDSTSDTFEKEVTLPTIDNDNVFSGYRVIIGDGSEDENVAVGIESLVLPKLDSAHNGYATLTVYLNDTALNDSNISAQIAGAVASDTTTIVIDVVIQITNVDAAPASIENLFDASNSKLDITLQRV